MPKEPPTNIRLSKEGRLLLEALAQAKGVSMTAIIEMAIREMASKEGLK